MSDYSWPSSVTPRATQWQLIANTASYVSPLTGTTRTVARGGDRWACSLTVGPLRGEQRADLMAFLARLRGQAHRVLIGDHSYARRGTQAANVKVKGASQTGTSLVVDGGTIGATLLAGDWISIGYLLHMVVSDATFSASGEATLTVTPPLRSSPADNADVEVVSPTGRFLLADQSTTWSNEPGGIAGTLSSFTVNLVEDIVA